MASGAGSSLVVRAGYGIYRNTSVYQSIAMLLAQQPPLSKTLERRRTPRRNPLTLANGFMAPPGATTNTFAVDPDFRVGYAQNWQASVQRDLPASLTVHRRPISARKGSHLMQEFLPNTYPVGAVNPVSDVPVRVRLPDVERHARMRHAGQMQVRRRLRNGLTATCQYTLAKATDECRRRSPARASTAAPSRRTG